VFYKGKNIPDVLFLLAAFRGGLRGVRPL